MQNWKFKFLTASFCLVLGACGPSEQFSTIASESVSSRPAKKADHYEVPDTVPLHDMGIDDFESSSFDFQTPSEKLTDPNSGQPVEIIEEEEPDTPETAVEQSPGKSQENPKEKSAEIKSDKPQDKAPEKTAGKTQDKPASEPSTKLPVKSQGSSSSQDTKTAPPAPSMKVVETGTLKPTVYYFPVYNEDKEPCDKGDMRTLHGVDGEKIINVCPSTLKSCGLQGACAVIQGGHRRSFNISNRINGQDRFFEMTNKECPYGYGVRNSCLDPFYTVAADLDIYDPGDVIFVPAVVGLQLPDGSTHNGYFVVRDQGRGINGKGRFDFYSGFLFWNDSKNPLRKIGLPDINTHLPYSVISGEKAQLILKNRGYPKLPSQK